MASAVCELRRLLLTPSMPWRSLAVNACRLLANQTDSREASIDRCDLAAGDCGCVADFSPTMTHRGWR